MTTTAEENREGYARRKAPALDGVRSEPRVYGPTSRHSFFQDLGLSAVHLHQSPDARERLHRLEVEQDAEVRDRTPEGRSLEVRRLQEQRIGSTSSSSAGFTTPQYLIDQWVAYRTPYRTFIDATDVHPMPPVGLQINIPSFTSAANTAFGAELTGSDWSYPTGSVIQQNVITISGGVTLSQQLFDLGGMSGLAYDNIVIQQLKISTDSTADNYIIQSVLTSLGTTVTNNTTWAASTGMPNFYANVATARESLADTAGTRLKATHIFSNTDIFSFITRQVDDQHRPIITPDWAAQPWAGLAMRGETSGDGWTGHVMPGNIAWFTDDNIPLLSGNAQIIVSRPNTVVTYEGDPIAFSYPETRAANLSVVVGVRKYLAVGPRFPNAHVLITGSAYVSTNI